MKHIVDILDQDSSGTKKSIMYEISHTPSKSDFMVKTDIV